MASADADALALADADEELFLLQIEVADLQSQLDIIQARITSFTEQLDIQPVILSAPTNEDAFRVWEAAGLSNSVPLAHSANTNDNALASSIPLEDGLRMLEQWIFSQPNWQQMTREGWIQFVYTIFGESLDKLLGVAH